MIDVKHATRLANKVEAAEESTTLAGTRLPYEIMDNIFGHLQSRLQLKTLASVVQGNRVCYDLAIQKLYETIIVTNDNQESLTYGMSEDLERSVETSELPIEKVPRRKDVAIGHTRKMMADTAPISHSVLHAYKGVSEVIVTARSHDILAPPRLRPLGCCFRGRSDPRWSCPLPPFIHKSIADFASVWRPRSPTPVHMDIQVSNDGFRQLLEVVRSPQALVLHRRDTGSVTYGFFDLPIKPGMNFTLQVAYALWGVVQFTEPERETLGEYAKTISAMLCQCLRSETSRPGRLFLCDVPKMVLSPEELTTSGDDINHIALLKLYDAWPTTHPKPAWDVFTRRVQLVDRGYRRTMAEFHEDMKNRIDPNTLELIEPKL